MRASLLPLLPLVALAAAIPDHADLILTHARIYTMENAQPRAEALAIRGKTIVAVGSAAEVMALKGPKTRIQDLGGHMVLPAFHDSHVHPIAGGVELGQCYVGDTESASEVVAKVRAYAAGNKKLAWIVGSGWDLTLFADGNPHKDLLDRVVKDRPVLLWAVDGHSVWVNSQALKLAHIDKRTSDPPAGRIERDPRTGEPTGTLRESAAELVSDLAPAPTPAEREKGLARALELMNRVGIVSAQEASAEEGDLVAYTDADRRGKLSARIRAAIHVVSDDAEAEAKRLAALRGRYRSPHFEAGTAKIFVDGVIESRTAALLAPYLDDDDGEASLGMPNFAPAALNRLVTRLDREKFQVHMHALGDGAVRIGLNALEAARQANGARDSRHVLAHLELIDPGDIPRFKALGAIASIQPLWAYDDEYVSKMTEPLLGPARSRRLYPFKELLDSGATVAGGSDWSVTSIAPLDAIEIAVTRRALGDARSKAWHPEQALSLQQALEAYTLRAAYVNFEEDRSGSLRKGKLADYVVLDQDLFAIAPSRIHKTRVLLTSFEGREVYREAKSGPTPAP